MWPVELEHLGQTASYRSAAFRVQGLWRLGSDFAIGDLAALVFDLLPGHFAGRWIDQVDLSASLTGYRLIMRDCQRAFVGDALHP